MYVIKKGYKNTNKGANENEKINLEQRGYFKIWRF